MDSAYRFGVASRAVRTPFRAGLAGLLVSFAVLAAGGARQPVRRTAAAPERSAPSGTAPASVATAVPERIGIVTHYFAHVNAAVVRLEEGEVHVGDTIYIRGHTTDFYQRVDHLEIDDTPVDHAEAGQEVGVHVTQRVREHDQVFRVSR